MPVRFIDANVFLRALTASEPTQTAPARALLFRLEAGTEKATTSALVLFEVIFTLHSPRSYNHPKGRVVDLISPLFELRGLHIPHKQLWLEAFDVWLEYPIDFTDAHNVATMRAAGVTEIYAWDRGYNNVSDIRRIEPIDEGNEAA